MSSDGYSCPDSGSFAFMGFPYGSAALTQYIDPNYNYVNYSRWLEDFFWSGYSLDMSVNDALNYASQMDFNQNFGDTMLHNSFTAIWPFWNTTSNSWYNATGPNSRLVLYGDGNIYLFGYWIIAGTASGGRMSGQGNAWNVHNIEGPSPDGQYGTVYGGNYGDAGYINGEFGGEAHGEIYLYGYSSPGYYSHLYVYVSDDGNNWNYVNDQYVTANSPYSIDVGTYSGNFKYISIVGYDDVGYSCCLNIDSVLVTP